MRLRQLTTLKLPTKLQRRLEIPMSFLSEQEVLLVLVHIHHIVHLIHQKASTTSLLTITQLHAADIIVPMNIVICSEATPATTAMDTTTSRHITIITVPITPEELITSLEQGLSTALITGTKDSMSMFGISSTHPLTTWKILSTEP